MNLDPSTTEEPLDEEESYRLSEERHYAVAFDRVEVRHRRLKTRLDCGHVIDGSEPYRYRVFRTNDMEPGHIEQRTDCEFCARRYNHY